MFSPHGGTATTTGQQPNNRLPASLAGVRNLRLGSELVIALAKAGYDTRLTQPVPPDSRPK
jgi:hypothetical protein